MFHFDCIYFIFTFYFETDVFIDMIEKRKNLFFGLRKEKKSISALNHYSSDHGFLVVFLYILCIKFCFLDPKKSKIQNRIMMSHLIKFSCTLKQYSNIFVDK